MRAARSMRNTSRSGSLASLLSRAAGTVGESSSRCVPSRGSQRTSCRRRSSSTHALRAMRNNHGLTSSATRGRRAQARLAQQPPPPSGVAPDGELERRQLAQALTRALDRLPIEQRIAFVLCAVEERTSVDAAALAGTNESTMRARVFHARRKLREHLAGYEDGGSL